MSVSTLVPNLDSLRSELGDFSSIVCFKAVVVGIEEALGEKAAAISLIAAGRARGKKLAQDLGIEKATGSVEHITPLIQEALGKKGTRLCIIDNIVEADDVISVYCRETVCSAGEPQGSIRTLSFTLGALQGVLEHVTGKRLRGKQVESVLRGGTHDVVAFGVIG